MRAMLDAVPQINAGNFAGQVGHLGVAAIAKAGYGEMLRRKPYHFRTKPGKPSVVADGRQSAKPAELQPRCVVHRLARAEPSARLHELQKRPATQFARIEILVPLQQIVDAGIEAAVARPEKVQRDSAILVAPRAVPRRPVLQFVNLVPEL